jgi:hypothetical protein
MAGEHKGTGLDVVAASVRLGDGRRMLAIRSSLVLLPTSWKLRGEERWCAYTGTASTAEGLPLGHDGHVVPSSIVVLRLGSDPIYPY